MQDTSLISLTVVVRDQTFHLSEAQIAFDSPNYFTTALQKLTDLPVAQRRITLDRNPQFFSVVVEYLTGYTILPLATSTIAPNVTIEVALQNLLEDAKYYRCKKLERMLIEWRTRSSSFEYVVAEFPRNGPPTISRLPITEHMASVQSSSGNRLSIPPPGQTSARTTMGYTPHQLELANKALQMLDEDDRQHLIDGGSEKLNIQSNVGTTRQQLPRYINAIAHWESSPFGWARIALVVSCTMAGAGGGHTCAGGNVQVLPVAVGHSQPVDETRTSGFHITLGGR